MVRYMFGRVLLILSALAVGGWAQNSPPGGQHVAYSTPQSIEKKASLANADDPNSIRGLVDEVFNFPRAFPRMPNEMQDMAKNRLVQAEILYKQGKKPGIEERDIVATLNDLADKLSAPAHSKTTPSQVRLVRMSLALSQPKFMGTGLTHDGIALGESVSSAMSPLQAAHLISTVIDQKVLNPDFQVSPEEWEATGRSKVEEKLQEHQALAERARTNPGSPSGTAIFSSHSADRRRELENSLTHGIASLSLTDGLNLIDQAFAKLRID
jgi:hypothetical protein